MELVGQRVDDGDGRIFGHLLDAFLPEGAPDDAVGHTGEYARGVGDRLASAQLGAGLVDDQRISAEFRHADREARTGTSAGLVEQHGDTLRAFKRPLVEAVFAEFQSKGDDLLLLVMIDVIIAKHVAQLTIHTVFSNLYVLVMLLGPQLW